MRHISRVNPCHRHGPSLLPPNSHAIDPAGKSRTPVPIGLTHRKPAGCALVVRKLATQTRGYNNRPRSRIVDDLITKFGCAFRVGDYIRVPDTSMDVQHTRGVVPFLGQTLRHQVISIVWQQQVRILLPTIVSQVFTSHAKCAMPPSHLVFFGTMNMRSGSIARICPTEFDHYLPTRCPRLGASGYGPGSIGRRFRIRTLLSCNRGIRHLGDLLIREMRVTSSSSEGEERPQRPDRLPDELPTPIRLFCGSVLMFFGGVLCWRTRIVIQRHSLSCPFATFITGGILLDGGLVLIFVSLGIW